MARRCNMSARMSRQWTDEEIREIWLGHVWATIDYWVEKGADRPPRELLKAFAFSLLSTIDGTGSTLPGFILAPRPHPDDRAFRQQRGENYFPENHTVEVTADIGGELHDLFHGFDPKKPLDH